MINQKDKGIRAIEFFCDLIHKLCGSTRRMDYVKEFVIDEASMCLFIEKFSTRNTDKLYLGRDE
jgi:hypothetical protein